MTESGKTIARTAESYVERMAAALEPRHGPLTVVPATEGSAPPPSLGVRVPERIGTWEGGILYGTFRDTRDVGELRLDRGAAGGNDGGPGKPGPPSNAVRSSYATMTRSL